MSMNVVVFASRKGGTGKSTLTAHLSAQAAKPSRRTLLIDADPQGSLSLWHELRGAEQPSLKRAMRGIDDVVKAAKREGYEWVFIDTSPNRSSIVSDAIRLATLVVIPARPSVFDIAAVTDTIEICRELRKPYAVVINAAPAKRSDAEAAIVADARGGLTGIKVPVWSGQITQRSDLSFALGAGAGAKEFDPDSLAAAEIANLWSAIERSVKAINGAHESARAMHRAAA
jgi:chromosome partitioning protein